MRPLPPPPVVEATLEPGDEFGLGGGEVLPFAEVAAEVEEAAALDRKAAADLLRPWLGDAVLPDLPLPHLVTVRLDPDAPASAVSLSRALAEPLDAAFVIGGRNSSNTYQLYRLCAEKLGDRAYFIQSESSILSAAEVEHYVYDGSGQGHIERRKLLLTGGSSPKRVLITGGASCPDGIIQQVISRINGFFPVEKLLPVAVVLRNLGS